MDNNTAPADGVPKWYAVYCKPLSEQLTATVLYKHLGLSSYLPLVNRVAHGRNEQIPLFPGYLFVHVDLQIVGVGSINATPGVLRLLSFGEDPQPVPDELVVGLREQISYMNAHGGLPTHAYKPGDVVTIKQGALRGLSAIFTGPTTSGERVRILLEFMGRRQELEIDPPDLEDRPRRRERRQERRTRGKGRRIRVHEAAQTQGQTTQRRVE